MAMLLHGMFAVLDDSASVLFLTDIMRGMAYTLGAFFDKKVTVRHEAMQEAWGDKPATPISVIGLCSVCSFIDRVTSNAAVSREGREEKNCVGFPKTSVIYPAVPDIGLSPSTMAATLWWALLCVDHVPI